MTPTDRFRNDLHRWVPGRLTVADIPVLVGDQIFLHPGLFEERQSIGSCRFSPSLGMRQEQMAESSTLSGRLMANVLASVAQFETEIRGERIRAGQEAARANGTWWGGSGWTPFKGH
jgi:hypothetical protein